MYTIRRLVQLAVGEIIIGTTTAGAYCSVFAGFAISLKIRWRKLSVIGKGVGILPDFFQRALSQVTFDKSVVIHGFAASDVTSAVNSNTCQTCTAAPEYCFSAEISS